MKVLPFKILKTREQNLLFQEDRDMILYELLHQHEEIQISIIEKGSGNLLVGDVFTSFHEGDVIIFGKNLPHVLKSEETCSMISIFFTKECFGKDFFDLPDMEEVSELISQSDKGLLVSSNLEKIKALMLEFGQATKLERFQLFIRILDTINKSEKKQLSSFLYNKELTLNEGKRMSSVFDYLMKNVEKEISLQEVADVAAMSKNAFCRYFKQRTNKTFFQFLIEIRIERACGLLIKNPDLTVTEVSELCGFKNLSNFNRKFKEIKLMSPKMIKKSKNIA
jgi:AraC-like DNA-binding protein